MPKPPLRTSQLRDFDVALGRAERAIALFARCRVENPSEVLTALDAALEGGPTRALSFRHTGGPPLTETLHELQHVGRAADASDHPLAPLYAERARELSLEGELAERVGARDFHELSKLRHAPSASELDAANDLAARWITEPIDASPDPPGDLGAALARWIGELGLPFRLEARPGLASAAATGARTLYYDPERELGERAVERVALHEALGHALPRTLALRQAVGLFSVGTRGGPDDEEGRALWLEHQHGFLDGERRRELGVRHVAASLVRAGASVVETARDLDARGTPRPMTLRATLRAHRGGGLAREIVYLPALARVSAAITADPSVQAWLAHGRVSVDAIPTLARAYGDVELAA